jgi:hypothetical protein
LAGHCRPGDGVVLHETVVCEDSNPRLGLLRWARFHGQLHTFGRVVCVGVSGASVRWCGCASVGGVDVSSSVVAPAAFLPLTASTIR